ncbi:hypothetical protein DAX91_22595 [Salmonella enterica subsp. enterica]|uniref:Uncharacterized protein n=1 Tax=Salmonella enterica I TaxID=59201 RepID=A0A315FUY7_SALET|nr:hypothetical protein DAX85_26685 [Salmonella enterica subsp. enterica]PUF68481.1 hypothetical protein DAX59_23240 [Salmonella enterica subsp. enterica]PUF77789.1 hypothetical protein DAX91_22595 [Salmonella enterica subsp. enterica]PUO73367.1 hypothetical protein DAX76_21170 [Salmonella enterica subsp. enterica]PUP12130.1 hypothetical protein DAX70_18685 [Salmonella enterica subsp. enterica]
MKAESRGRRRKVFAPGKNFLSEFIHPLRDDKPVLQTALREGSLREGTPAADRMNTPDTAERRGAIRRMPVGLSPAW